MKGALRIFVILLFFVLIFFIFANISLYQTPSHGISTDSTLPDDIELKHIFQIQPDDHEEWLPVLRHGKIIQFRNIDEEVVGLADKYKIVFESGHQAVAKLMEPFNYFDREWKTVSILDPRMDDSYNPKRSNRKLQGWSEVACYFASKILFPGRKLPATIRKIPSDVLYKSNGFSIENYLKSLFPPHDVYVSVQSWLGKFTNQAPSVEYFKFLSRPPDPRFTTASPIIKKKYAGEVSDLIAWDFIIDDHDRHRNHNWMVDGSGALFFWDNGLAFNHGPNGRSSCLDLLCGPDSWREYATKVELASDKHCIKICKFRNETISRLRHYAQPETKFSDAFIAELEQEEFDSFSFNLYYPYSARFPKYRHISSDFPVGLDLKIAKFLTHVDQCILDYGEEFVLDNTLI